MVFVVVVIFTIITDATIYTQWLRCCATNRKVAGSIPAGVSEFFIDIKSFWTHYAGKSLARPWKETSYSDQDLH